MHDLPDEDPAVPVARTPLGYLAQLARRQWRSMLAATIFDTIWLVGLALVPFSLGRCIDDGIVAGDTSALVFWCAVLLLLAIEQAAIQALRDRAGVNNWNQAAYRTTQTLGRHISATGPALPRALSTGELITTVNGDAMSLSNVYFMTSGLISSVVACVVVAAIVLDVSVPLGLFVLFGVPVFSGLLFLVVRPMRTRQREQREASGRMTALGADTVAGLRILRGLGGEREFTSRYRQASRTTMAAGIRLARPLAALQALQVLVGGSLVVGLTWFGAALVAEGSIRPGALVSFYGYAAFLVMPIDFISGAISTFVRALIGARRVNAVRAVTAATSEPAAPAPAPGEPGEVVDTASGLRIRPGILTVVAAADATDAEAILERLARLDDAELAKHPVLWGDLPSDRLAVDDVRALVVLSDAEPSLFSGTLRSLIDPFDAYSDDRVNRVLYAAAAEELLEFVPGGLNGTIAERGRNLSGGQRQRAGLARALVGSPHMLLLLNPTSAVDAHTEQRIAVRLAAERQGMTTVVASTSPALLACADQVAFVSEGRVTATGTHGSLLDHADYRAVVFRGQD